MKMQKVKKLICQNIERIEYSNISVKDKISLYEDVILLNFYLENKLNKCTKLSNPLLWRVK